MTAPTPAPHLSAAEAYWHGGAPGRLVGERLLPPAKTGVVPCSDFLPPGVHSPSRRDRVYITTVFLEALMFAVMHPHKGYVYRVIPIGPIERDPDYMGSGPGGSFQCEEAIIIEKVIPRTSHRKAVLKAMGLWR